MMTIVDTLVCEWKTPGEKKTHTYTYFFAKKYIGLVISYLIVCNEIKHCNDVFGTNCVQKAFKHSFLCIFISEMRKVVNVNGRKVFVYRKGHENKLLGRTFVKHWKEGKVGPPSNGKHTLQTDTNGNLRVITSGLVGHRRISYKKLGLHKSHS